MSLSKLNPLRVFPPVVAGAVTMFTLLSVMSVAGEWLNAMPQVGDMIAFKPTVEPGAPAAAKVIARTADSRVCVLDSSTLRRSGGSFVVERPAESAYVVHWAGPRTADGDGDCGSSADLILLPRDLSLLGYAASIPPADFTTDLGA